MAEVVDIDLIISKLLEVRGARPGKNVQLSEVDIRNLCLKSREIFLSQPILLELEAPLKICGEWSTIRWAICDCGTVAERKRECRVCVDCCVYNTLYTYAYAVCTYIHWLVKIFSLFRKRKPRSLHTH